MHKSVTDKTLQNKLISVVSEAGTVFLPVTSQSNNTESCELVFEPWEFTLEDGSIVQKNVALGIEE